MAVKLRMKKMGRTHRPFYRVCAFDGKAPRDGRALEELGTYDTSLANTDARAVLNSERIDYWLSVGAQPSDKVAVLIKKYGTNGTHLEQQKAALDELAAPRSVPNPGAVAAPKQPEAEEPAEAAAEGGEAPTEATAEAPAEEAKVEETPAEEAPAEETKTEETKTEE